MASRGRTVLDENVRGLSALDVPHGHEQTGLCQVSPCAWRVSWLCDKVGAPCDTVAPPPNPVGDGMGCRVKAADAPESRP